MIGSENWDGSPARQFALDAEVTAIGSAPTCDLVLMGLDRAHAQIRHDANDEYVLYSSGHVSVGSRPGDGNGREDGGIVLRTGSPIGLGKWRLGFFREEFADHGRPFGGRAGGELSYQRSQPARPSGQS
ncbi:MAG: hypothetical protein JWO10_2352 [Microbacteriaceae bacterium]|nr:hypothetical protein [Microbacteriaceae bacterium]